MKQHDIHNDEALYLQILAELAPGAEEYDRVVEQRLHPAAKRHRIIPYYKYVAAACVLFAFVGGAWFMQEGGRNEQQTQPVSHLEIKKQQPTDKPSRLLAAEEVQQEKSPAAPSHNQRPISQSSKNMPYSLTVTQTASTTKDPLNTSDNTPDEELYFAILSEIENRVVSEHKREEFLHQALIDELTNIIIENPEGPQLTL